jgi:hypothetical protein
MPADAISSTDMRTRGGIGKVIDSPAIREKKRTRNYSRSIRRMRNRAQRSIVQTRESAKRTLQMMLRQERINLRMAQLMDNAISHLSERESRERYANQ